MTSLPLRIAAGLASLTLAGSLATGAVMTLDNATNLPVHTLADFQANPNCNIPIVILGWQICL